MKNLLIFLAAVFLFASCGNGEKKQNKVQTEVSVVESPRTSMDLNEFKDIKLLAPDFNKKAPLMEAFKNRQTNRVFGKEELSFEDLSNVLWGAYGINRPNGKRTVPSAMAIYPIDVYAVLSNGIYYYDAENNELKALVEGDHRRATGASQPFVQDAPLNILYIADMSKYDKANFSVEGDVRMRFAMADAGHSSQNVYLYCAAAEMKTVIRGGGFNEPELLKLLNLNENHTILLAQTVGY